MSWPTPKPPKAERKSPRSLLEAQFAPKEDETEDERVEREAALYAAKKKLLESKEEGAEEEVKPEDEAANMDLPATTYVGEFRGGLRHGKGKFVQPVKLIVRKPLDEKEETEERKAKKKELMAELAKKQKEKAEDDKAAGKTRRKKKKGVVEIEVITIEYEGEWAAVCSFSNS